MARAPFCIFLRTLSRSCLARPETPAFPRMTGVSLAEAGIFVVCALAATLLSGAYRRFALSRAILDEPNARSSHRQPVPRGGGIAVAAVVIAGGLMDVVARRGARSTVLLLTAAALVGLVGWLDDRRSTRVSTRLTVHLLGAAVIAYVAMDAGLPITLALLWAFGAVSAINVVNFMDGIDALVTSQVLIFAASASLLAPGHSYARDLAIVLAGGTLGFLAWNWPPARLFLGDAGSGFLGFCSVAVGLLVVLATGDSMARVFLPLFPLSLDAAVTLARRARNGERLTEAHRSHLYQRLANGQWGHGKVSATFAACAFAGSVVSLVPRGPTWPFLVAAYVGAIVALGWWMERSSPFPDGRSGQ